MGQGMVVTAGESGTGGAQALKPVTGLGRQAGKYMAEMVQERGQGRKVWG